MIANFPKNEIKEYLESTYRISVSKYIGTDVLGTFLFGSQNYNLDTPNSDVDVITILIPSLYDIAISKDPINEHFDYYDNAGKIVAKDIREMLKMWQRQSINFTEILFTPYCVINPKYSDLWKQIIDRRNQIAYWNRHKAAYSVVGQIKSLSSKLMTGKDYVNIMRLIEFLKCYNDNISYDNAVKVSYDFRENYLPIKINKDITIHPSATIKNKIDEIVNNIDSNPLFKEINTSTDDSYNRLLTELGILIKTMIWKRG